MTWDVLFDEYTLYSGELEATAEMILEMDSLVARIELLESLATNESILDLKDKEILEPLVDSEDKEPGEGVATFDEKEDYELAWALEEALLTPLHSEIDPESALHV